MTCVRYWVSSFAGIMVAFVENVSSANNRAGLRCCLENSRARIHVSWVRWSCNGSSVDCRKVKLYFVVEEGCSLNCLRALRPWNELQVTQFSLEAARLSPSSKSRAKAVLKCDALHGPCLYDNQLINSTQRHAVRQQMWHYLTL